VTPFEEDPLPPTTLTAVEPIRKDGMKENDFFAFG
jgi:hypothetical protein